MTKYLISFPSSAMSFSEEDLRAASDASHAVVEEAKEAGVWVFGGAIDDPFRQSWSMGTARSPKARIRRPSSSKAATRYWNCLPAQRHWNGLRRSRAPAGARRRFDRSITIPPADRTDRRWRSCPPMRCACPATRVWFRVMQGHLSSTTMPDASGAFAMD